MRENWMREKKMRKIWSWAKIKWIKVCNKLTFFLCFETISNFTNLNDSNRKMNKSF